MGVSKNGDGKSNLRKPTDLFLDATYARALTLGYLIIVLISVRFFPTKFRIAKVI